MAAPLPQYLLPDTSAITNGRLSIGGCDTLELAAQFGTPLFVYDEEHLRARCKEAVATFGDGVAYATKAFLCKAMARLAHEEGMHLDVATGGELWVALQAGVPAERLVLHGNNKSPVELAMALEAGVGRIVIDSFDELGRLEDLAAGRSEPVPVLIRITPGSKLTPTSSSRPATTTPSSGSPSRPGPPDQAITRAGESPDLDLVGLHAHIGSQVFRLASFEEAARVVARAAAPYELSELSLGGGLGVPYVAGESAPSITEWGQAIIAACRDEGVTGRVTAEPGRAIVAAAAVTLYTAGTIKDIPGTRTYVAVDGGMSDNPRPVLYGSGYEAFLPRATGRSDPARSNRRQALRIGRRAGP